MTVALRAESRKLLTTQVWFWMFILQLGLTLLVACLVSAFSKTTDTGVPVESILNGTVGFSVLIASVLGVIGITGEYRHLTATPTFLSVPLSSPRCAIPASRRTGCGSSTSSRSCRTACHTNG